MCESQQSHQDHKLLGPAAGGTAAIGRRSRRAEATANRAVRAALAGLVSLAAAGCSGNTDPYQDLLPETVPVSGYVTFNGNPLEGAKVCFHPEEVGGKAALGTTNSKGWFQLRTFSADDGAIPGPYLATVDKNTVAIIPRPADDSGSQIAVRIQITPEKYKFKESTDLRAIVKNTGDNVFPFELFGEAPIATDQLGAGRLRNSPDTAAP